MDPELVRHLFTYHPPKDGEPQKYAAIRSAGLAFAMAVLDNTPKSPDQSVTIRCIREAVMWANSAIANEGRG